MPCSCPANDCKTSKREQDTQIKKLINFSGKTLKCEGKLPLEQGRAKAGFEEEGQKGRQIIISKEKNIYICCASEPPNDLDIAW